MGPKNQLYSPNRNQTLFDASGYDDGNSAGRVVPNCEEGIVAERDGGAKDLREGRRRKEMDRVNYQSSPPGAAAVSMNQKALSIFDNF